MCDFLVAEYWHDFRSSRYVTTESVHLGCTGTQVRSPHRHSGLRIQCCCSCGLGQNGGSDLTPGPRAPHAMGSQKRKERKQTTPPHSPPPEHWRSFKAHIRVCTYRPVISKCLHFSPGVVFLKLGCMDMSGVHWMPFFGKSCSVV